MKKVINNILEFFSDKEDTKLPKYDPVHFGGMIILTIFAISLLFWLLWSLLVFGGGIQAKIIPFFQIVFTSRTAADFGYVGYPYEMGIFEGWITNVVALILLISVIAGIWYIFNNIKKSSR